MGRRIICFGVSNTYGYDPCSYLGGRYPKSLRWTGRLELAVLQLYPGPRPGGLCEPVPCHIRPGHRPAEHRHEENPQRQRAVHLPIRLVHLGRNGNEFKETRDILLANLDGNRAWHHGKDSYEVNSRKKGHRENER